MTVVVIAALAGFYALSWFIAFKGQPVAQLPELYAKRGSLTSVFRSSGRFTWPLHALFTLAALSVVVRFGTRVWLQRGVLAAALPAVLLSFVLPANLHIIGTLAGAVCATFAIAVLCNMAPKRAAIAAGIYFVVQIALGYTAAAMFRV